MKHRVPWVVGGLGLPAALFIGLVSKGPEAPTSAGRSPGLAAPAARTIGTLSPGFEANRGQTDPRVWFLARGRSHTLFLSPAESVLSVRDTGNAGKPRVVRMKCVGGRSRPRLVGVDELPGRSHYLIGRDARRWHRDIPRYARVRYEEVYPGIDMVFQDGPGRLEYDLVVAPGADPKRIRVAFEGTKSLRLDEGGNLRLSWSGGEITQHSPVVYQEAAGRRQVIAGAYRLTGKREVGFEVAAYDATRPLVIDPVLTYSTYLGGGDIESGYAVAADAAGAAYVTGSTRSADFPTAHSLQGRSPGDDVFVTKLDPDGRLVYSTYLGGSGTSEWGAGIAVDAEGSVYLTGATNSSDFPTVNPLQPNYAGGVFDAFVAKLDATGSAIVYSTYLGGALSDKGDSIALDGSGHAFLTGVTASIDFPTVNPMQPVIGSPGFFDAYVAKLDPAGTALVYSTYLGGVAMDVPHGIGVDGAGSAYVGGSTLSDNFPTLNALQPARAGMQDAFVTKFDPAGALVYSTYFGTSKEDSGYDLAVDAAGEVYLTGATIALDFPTVNALQATRGGTTVYRSRNGGQTWRACGLQYDSITCLAIDPLNPSTIYAGTRTSGVSKSTDGGETWTAINTGLTSARINALAVDPLTPSTLYAGTPTDGLFKSMDGGASWSTLSLSISLPTIFALAFDPLNPQTLYAGGSNQGTGWVAKTTNAGADWTGGLLFERDPVTVAVDPHNPMFVYAGTIDKISVMGGGVFKSLDGGSLWIRSSNGMTNQAGRFLNVYALAIDRFDSLVLYAAVPGYGVYRSLNGGLSWEPKNAGLGNLAPLVLALPPSVPLTLYAGTNGSGIFKTADGAESWTAVNEGLPTLSALALAADPVDPSTIYAGIGAGNWDAFLVKIDSSGSALVYSTYLGGGGNDYGMAVAVDNVGQAYVAGYTDSRDFPAVQALQPKHGGGFDAFFEKIDPTGRTLIQSTLLGGSGSEHAFGVAVDVSGNAYVFGDTTSTNFPVANAPQPLFGGLSDTFVAKIGASSAPTPPPASGTISAPAPPNPRLRLLRPERLDRVQPGGTAGRQHTAQQPDHE